MQRAIALITPARWPEPLSRTHLEALAAGCPIVATDTGGTREVIADGVTGFLASVGDVETWRCGSTTSRPMTIYVHDVRSVARAGCPALWAGGSGVSPYRRLSGSGGCPNAALILRAGAEAERATHVAPERFGKII